MRTKTVEVYQYNELSESAKEKARDWYLYASYDDVSFAWDDIQEDAKEAGLNLDEYDYGRYCVGNFSESARDCAQAIITNHGESCETYKTARAFLNAAKQFSEDDADETSAEYDNLRELENDFLKSILEDYRILADRDVDHMQSEEYIADVMESNGYEFTADGRRFSA